MPRRKTFKLHLPPQRTPEGDLRQFNRGSPEIIFLNKPEVDFKDFNWSEPAGVPRELDVPTEILLPEYAIGVGLISRDEYDSIRRDYFTQTQWTLGLIIPLIMLWIALGIRPEPLPWWLHVVFLLLAGVALIGGMDRLHNYYAQLQSLIAGKYVAKLIAREAAEAAAAAAKQPAAGGGPTLKDLRGDLAELKALIERELQRPPVTVVTNVREQRANEASEPPVAETARASDAARTVHTDEPLPGVLRDPDDEELRRRAEEILEMLRRKQRRGGDGRS